MTNYDLAPKKKNQRLQGSIALGLTDAEKKHGFMFGG